MTNSYNPIFVLSEHQYFSMLCIFSPHFLHSSILETYGKGEYRSMDNTKLDSLHYAKSSLTTQFHRDCQAFKMVHMAPKSFC